MVEQKKGKNEEGGYRRRPNQSMGQNVHMAKLQSQHAEDKVSMKQSHKGPTLSRKKLKWQQNTWRANHAGNTQGHGNYQRRGIREHSYEIKPEWPTLVEFSKQRQDKLLNLTPGLLGEFTDAGQIHQFNMSFEKARVQRSIKIPKHQGSWEENSIIDDEIIQEIAGSGRAHVFITDEAAAAIMCSTRAVYSWDVQIKKFQNMLFIDKREEENMLRYQTVHETAQPDYQPLDDDSINGTRQLMREAARVHTNILQAAQGNKFTKLERDDPHEEAEDQKMLRLGYKYKLFRLSSEPDLVVCIRCQNHFLNDVPSEGLSNLFVLLEWNHKRQSWTKDLDLMTNVMLNKEINDNASKFNRWTMQSLLDGVEKMRFAFVQRADIASDKAHKVVGFYNVNPTSFANEINLNLQNCWAVLKDLVVTVLD